MFRKNVANGDDVRMKMKNCVKHTELGVFSAMLFGDRKQSSKNISRLLKFLVQLNAIRPSKCL